MIPQADPAATLHEATGGGEEGAASTGGRHLILPGRAGELFPKSPKQKQLHSYDAKGSEEYNIVDNKTVLEPEIQHMLLWVSTRAAQRY